MIEHLFVEVVKVQNGVFVNPQPHIERMFRTTLHFFSKLLSVELTDDMIPVNLRNGLVKCRIVYNSNIVSIGFEPYKIRNIKRLHLVENNNIHYKYKYLNRDLINKLIPPHDGCDDILIVKNRLVTDTSYSNVVFEEHTGKLYTPKSTLLAGTKREQLLNSGIIHKKEIYVSDIRSYVGVYLINAMMDLEDKVFVGVDAILG